MPIDPQYLDAIKGFEGYSPTPAWDYKQNSSGYGTVAQPGDSNIPPDQLRAIHEQRFQDEIAKAADRVDNVNPNLPPGAKAALTSLTYNAGPGWSQSSLGDLVRNGDLAGAAAKMLEYNRAGGQVNPGLVARRQKEAAWFGGGLPQSQPATPASPANAPPAPLNLIPPQAAPIFAQQPQAAPEAPPQSAFAQMQVPTAQAPPIFTPPRKPIDLSKLRAAFQRPVFYGNS
jgi:lysozyme